MKVIVFFIMSFSASCFASYTANYNSKISWVKIYNSDMVYFGLEDMPKDHQCSGNFFALSASLTESKRNRYYSMLLAAKTSGAPVTVGYDNLKPKCLNGRPVAEALSF